WPQALLELQPDCAGAYPDVVVRGVGATRVVVVLVQPACRVNGARPRQALAQRGGASVHAQRPPVVSHGYAAAAALAALGVMVAIVVGAQPLAVGVHGHRTVVGGDRKVILARAEVADGQAGAGALTRAKAVARDDVDDAAGRPGAVLHGTGTADDFDALDRSQRDGA